MPGTPIRPEVETELQRQLNHELGAAHAYTALAVWCFDRNYKGFARHFYKQSSEEHGHAQRFIDHLLDRGVMPKLQALPAPRTEFDGLVAVARHALAMEQANTVGIHQVYEKAGTVKDHATQVAMHWFISEQVEEENWATEMVQRTEAAGSDAGLSALDRHIERYLADRGHDQAE